MSGVFVEREEREERRQRRRAEMAAAAAASLSAVATARQSMAAHLRALREAHGLTQAELSRRTGIARPNIARVERGSHMTTLDVIVRIARAIGVRPSEILIALDAQEGS